MTRPRLGNRSVFTNPIKVKGNNRAHGPEATKVRRPSKDKGPGRLTAPAVVNPIRARARKHGSRPVRKTGRVRPLGRAAVPVIGVAGPGIQVAADGAVAEVAVRFGRDAVRCGRRPFLGRNTPSHGGAEVFDKVLLGEEFPHRDGLFALNADRE